MEEALGFFRAFEVWIYLLLGLGGLFYVRKFILSWQELREAAFGLERENAQSRLNQSATALVLLLALAVLEFVLVSFVAPTVPGASPLPTPTLDLLATPTTTLQAETAVPEGQTVAQLPATATIMPQPENETCLPGTLNIRFPTPGAEVSGIVDVLGTANIPNFGFYKLEMKRPEESTWLTVQAGNQVVPDQEGNLGKWDTRRLPPGEYDLGLVVVDNQGQATTHCVARVRVTMVAETVEP